ncbi:sporulation YhaL family protein [Alteribacillus sp. HJP-4]|uniref:sporulation YhaL family protein n=1 Tax=Alteribacillus sp. HJP-4 TaxID=2775394 RepID=UPI0035CD2062
MKGRSGKLIIAMVGVFFLLVSWQRFFAAEGAGLPAWVLLTALGIIFSGYMWRTTSKQEKESEQKWIEQEGSVFIRRMEDEKERKLVSKE